MADKPLAGTKRVRNNAKNNETKPPVKKERPLVPRNEVGSWIIYSIRRTIGEEDVRNLILKTVLPRDPNRVLGKTFVLFYNTEKNLDEQIAAYYTNVKVYLSEFIEKNKGKTLLFTIANAPSEGTPETHYQTVILRNTESPTAIFIDPARKSDGSNGIYEPWAINNCVKPFLEENGFTTSWLPVSQAPQTSKMDVFCQSWSLYLLKEAVLHPGSTIIIPKGQQERYALLDNFWKEASQIELFCEVLTIDRAAVLNTELKDILIENEHSTKNIQAILNYHKSFDPCTFIQSMKATDIQNA